MKLSVFGIKELDEAAIVSLVNETLESYPILKEIYNDRFIAELVKHRFNYDGYLLWLLTSKEHFTSLVWESVSKNLGLLRDSDAIAHFKNKLRSYEENTFEGYLTELDLAGHYKRLGYEVELEPTIPGTQKKPEFKVESKKYKVFFEIRSIFIEELLRRKGIVTQLLARLGKVKEPFVFDILFTTSFQQQDAGRLKQFTKEKLKELAKAGEVALSIDEAINYDFPNEKQPVARLRIWGRPKKVRHGYVVSIGVADPNLFTGLVEVYDPLIQARAVRSKITKKTRQLGKGETNVLVVEQRHFHLRQKILEAALFGDEGTLFYPTTGTTMPGPKKNRVFQPRKNTRLSAVMLYERRFDQSKFVVKKLVYHNPFAEKRLDQDFFVERKIRQLVPIERESGIKMVWTDCQKVLQ